MITRRFEVFVANRYLRAKRKQTAISVITVISILGVAAGVMALVIALAVSNGFQSAMQDSLLSATAHVTVREREAGPGISDWERLIPAFKSLPHVKSADPGLYGPVLLQGPDNPAEALIKGIDLQTSGGLADSLVHLQSGNLAGIDDTKGYPVMGIVLGSKLATKIDRKVGDVVKLISPQGDVTPWGPRAATYSCRVVGIFDSGVYELDSRWAYMSLKNSQKIFSLEDVINTIDIKLDDPERAPEVAKEVEKKLAPDLTTSTWIDDNRPISNALKMERIVMAMTVGLIQLVAGLNIFTTLMMMVMEKNRDIAVLLAMGARREQIRNIFLCEGLLIGLVGTTIGLILGYTACAVATYYKWPRLDEQVYELSYVHFKPLWYDGVWISGAALVVAWIATIWPARTATRIAPAEALRYE
ncbi:MAG TPA: ABC transporter permease [Bryobacteraceae bacterium]|jgi:lipoprotein-releasing system permease protein